MGDLKTAVALAAKIRGISKDVLVRHIGREDVVRATWLALVSGRPAFFLGPPGVDKTGTVQDLARRVDGAVFFDALMPTLVSVEQLLVESTSIEESPMADGGKSIKTRDTLGRAASAHVLFADEIWKAEPRVLQTVLDLAKGDGVRHEGTQVKTPLKAFLAASNELPDSEGNLGAVWSRMTIRVVVKELDRQGKTALVKARLAKARGASSKVSGSDKLTLSEVDELRAARSLVEIPDEIVKIVLDIVEQLRDENAGSFDWAWADDRRFGRLFDVMQANALLDGRTKVGKQDLAVLEWLLWDSPEQIPTVKAKLVAYCRTPQSEARELIDSLLVAGGSAATAYNVGRPTAGATSALAQCREVAEDLLPKLKTQAAGTPEEAKIQEWISAFSVFIGKLAQRMAGLNAGTWEEATRSLL